MARFVLAAVTSATLALTTVDASAAERAPLALSPGPHPVGFRVFNHRDATRRMEDGALRPVQIGVWYPATAR